jgi:hypothetical protein
VLINAKAIEKQVSPLFVKTEFVGTDEGREIISSMSSDEASAFPKTALE